MNRLIQELAAMPISHTTRSPEAETGEVQSGVPRHQPIQLDYYLYVSRSKVEMLYAQIPTSQRQSLATKLAIELPPDGNMAPTQEALFAKTKLVVALLEEQGIVGSVDNPKAYFKGQLALRWGPYLDSEELVYFGGETKDTILGLGGSLGHVIGQVGRSGAHSHSATPRLIEVLSKELGHDYDLPDWVRVRFPDDDSTSTALAAVELATSQMRGPQERIEFVARKLLCWPEHGVDYHWGGRSGRRVLLGSPIYASLVDA
jgi:hypothetical protein